VIRTHSQPELPPEEASLLRGLWATRSLPVLRSRVRELARSGWSQAAIARALDTYRSTVRTWLYYPTVTPLSFLSSDPDPSPNLPPVPVLTGTAPHPPPECPYLVPAVMSVKVGVLHPRLSPEQGRELRFLSLSARKVRGHTPQDARSRAAARRLDELLLTYRTQGVALRELARATTLTERAVRARRPYLIPVDELPEPFMLLDSPLYPRSHYVVLWPTPTHVRDRAWRTFVLASDPKTPVAPQLELLRFPHPATSVLDFHALSPEAAEYQLGWPRGRTHLLDEEKS
jgi:hypothetical protein